MPTKVINLDAFSLKSTWVASRYGVIEYTTPTTDKTTKTLDISSIMTGSTITAATLAINTNGAGDSKAVVNGTNFNVTNDHTGSNAVNILSAVSSMTSFGTLAIQFKFQAYGGTGSAPLNGKITYSRTCNLSSITLTIKYTLPYSKPTVTSLGLNKTTAYPGEGAVLSWSGTAGNNNAISKYQVFRATAIDGTYTLLSELTGMSLTVYAPTPNGTYYYKVKAIGSVQGYDGEPSGAVGLTVVCTVTAAPSTLTLSPPTQQPNTAAVLSWSGAAAGTNNPIVKYVVYRSESADGSYQYLGETPGTSISVTSANGSGGKYYYKVAAIGQYLSGGTSAVYATLTTTYSATSTPALSAGSVEADGSVTLTLTGNATSKAHTVTVYYGSKVLSYQMAAGVVSQAIAIPLEWLDQIPNATSEQGYVGVSTEGGGSVNIALSVTAPASVVPTISGGTASPLSTSVPASWGLYLSGQSKAVVTIPAGASVAGAYGSTITGYRIECAGQVITGAGKPLSLTTGLLYAGDAGSTYTARVIAIDSRGREGAQEISIPVLSYAAPYSNDMSAVRCSADGTEADEGTYIKAAGTIVYASCGGLNSVTAKVKYRRQGGPEWSDCGSMTGGAGKIIGGGGIEIDASYEVQVTMSDALGTTTAIELIVSRASFALHFCYDGSTGKTGAAFGKAATRVNAVDIPEDWTIYKGSKDVLGLTHHHQTGLTNAKDDWNGGLRTAFYGPNTLPNQPSSYGNLLSIGMEGEVSQVWLSQAIGSLYHRQGNGSGWNGAVGETNGWVKILDNNDLSGTDLAAILTIVNSGGDGTIQGYYNGAEGGFITFARKDNAKFILNWKRATITAALTAWNNVYYADVYMGNWFSSMNYGFGVFTGLSQPNGTAVGWVGGNHSSNETSAGYVRVFSASSTAAERTVYVMGIGYLV